MKNNNEKDKIVVEECLRLHNSGVKNTELAKRYGCHPNSIRKFLHKNGIETPKDKLSQEDKDIIIDLYVNKLYSSTEIPPIAKLPSGKSVSEATVQRIVNEAGVSRSISVAKKLKFNKA